VRVTLAVVLVASVTLTCWNLGRGDVSGFYATSARSMSESWRALLSGAFDPGATVTLDKLSGFAVPQALSVRLLGDSASAMALPQVLEGLLTVWACALVGLRWAGPGTGLLAAVAAAGTPVFVSMFGHPMEDGAVTAALAVALLCWQRWSRTGRWWPLVAAGLAIGLGFQAKMAQAWFIVPALLVGTLVAAEGGALRRIGRTAVFGGVAGIASIAWMLGMQLVPAGDRPYVDGSTDDSVWAMVFGYNGVDRLLPGAWPGAVSTGGRLGGHAFGASSAMPGRTGHGPTGHGGAGFGGTGHAGAGFGGTGHAGMGSGSAGSGGAGHHDLAAAALQHLASNQDGGIGKLFGATYASQVGWLWPTAVVGIVLAVLLLVARRRARGRGDRSGRPEHLSQAGWEAAPSGTAGRPDQVGHLGGALDDRAGRAMLVVLVVWLGTAAAVLSVARLPHTAYVAAIGVQLALLAALGWRAVVDAASAPARSTRVWFLVLAAAQTLWVVRLARTASMPLVLAVPAVALGVAGVVVGLVLLVARTPAGTVAARRAVAVVAAVTVLAGPTGFAMQALDASRDGSSGDASVGTVATHFRQPGASAPFHVSTPEPLGGTVRETSEDRALVTLAHRDGGGRAGAPLFLTDSWRIASDVIVATGRPVLTDGGFSGSVPVFTTAQVRARIADGLHVVVVGAGARADDPVVRALADDHGRCHVTARHGGGSTHTTAARWGGQADAWTMWRCS
jgi:4-amino-4-deoxy-L-arabinose transferase-like glycosyltransferase